MFASKFSALAIALAVPLVSALSITTPSGWTSASQENITWTAVNGDPQVFNIFLINQAFHDSFGIANNVETGAMQLSLLLPSVPVRDGYTLQFQNVSNNADVFAQTGDFAIGATPNVTTTSTSTTSTASSIPPTAPTVAPTDTSGFGTTTSGSTSATVSVPGSSSGTSSSSVGSTTPFNGGAVKLGISRDNLVACGIMAIAAVAGARFAGF